MKTSDEIKVLEEKCTRLIKSEKLIRFAGIINRLGKLEAGGFRDDIQPHVMNEKTKMLYMQMVLDLNMRQEFNDELGKIKWSASRRDKVLMMTVPIKEDILLISAEPESQTGHLYKKAIETFLGTV